MFTKPSLITQKNFMGSKPFPGGKGFFIILQKNPPIIMAPFRKNEYILPIRKGVEKWN
jgi:hypothetical protein